MQDLIWHILTPNPKFRPSIAHILKILENWDSIEEIKLNPEAIKNKKAYIKRIEAAHSSKRDKVPLSSGELTEDEIKKIQKRIQMANEKKKQKLFVPIYNDYSAKMEHDLYSNSAQNVAPKETSSVGSHTQHQMSEPRESQGQVIQKSQQEVPRESRLLDSSDDEGYDVAPVIQSSSRQFDFDFHQPQSRRKLYKINLFKILEKQKNDFADFDFDSSNKHLKKSTDDWFFDFEDKTQKNKQKSNWDQDFEDFEKPKYQKSNNIDSFNEKRNKDIKTQGNFFDDFESIHAAKPKYTNSRTSILILLYSSQTSTAGQP